MPLFGLTEPASYIVIVGSTAIIWSLMTLAIRVFLRTKINGPFGWDDFACCVATFLAVLYSTICLTQIGFGLGRHSEDVSASMIRTSRILGWVNSMIYNCGLSCSTLSMCFLIARVCEVQKRKVRFVYGVAFATSLFGLATMLATALQCRLPEPWNTTRPRHCVNLWALYATTSVAFSALELANVLAATNVVWRLHMPLCPKIQVVTLFALRLLILAPQIIRLRYLHVVLFADDSAWQWVRVPLQIINNVIIHLSIILATVPCAKPFLHVLESGGHHMPTVSSTEMTATGILQPRSLVGSEQSKTLRLPQWRGNTKKSHKEGWRVRLRPDHSHTETSIRYDPQDASVAARRRSIVRSESSNTVIKVMRTDSVTVVYDQADKLLHQKKKSVAGDEINNWKLPNM
ncbi:hypothetical protein LTR97_004354 [Elasticomyces elasticus]|uniref:Rhodopsin domain-containing protein n=1 Tax=Elasticomyces elasticus TaxID=574655 RepID=A0AAN7WDD7_9PEZI|nr:hypothetical protein LTR97_004354 [Elasticomyces elasticus]